MNPAQNQPQYPPNAENAPHNQQSEEYYAALKNWVKAAQSWSNLAVAYRVLISSEICVLRAYNYGYNPGLGAPGLRNRGAQMPPNVPLFAPFTPPLLHTMGGIPTMPQGPQPSYAPSLPHLHLHRRSRFKIAPIWRRFVAEFIDFLLLFFFKLIATFIAIDFFDFMNLEKVDLDVFSKALDYKSFMELTAEIVVLELIHRVVVCGFETFWLKGVVPGWPGGSTPGKGVMGLCVVSCDEAICIAGHPESVFVKPGSALGLGRSFTRAFLKNFVLSILFPVCAFLVFFKHNQTAYDVVSKSIVIEVDHRYPPRQRQQ